MITTNLLYGPMLRTLLSVFDCTHTELGSCSMQLDVMPATQCFEDYWHMFMAALSCTSLMMLLPGVSPPFPPIGHSPAAAPHSTPSPARDDSVWPRRGRSAALAPFTIRISSPSSPILLLLE